MRGKNVHLVHLVESPPLPALTVLVRCMVYVVLVRCLVYVVSNVLLIDIHSSDHSSVALVACVFPTRLTSAFLESRTPYVTLCAPGGQKELVEGAEGVGALKPKVASHTHTSGYFVGQTSPKMLQF